MNRNIRDINQAMHDYIPRYYDEIREANAVIDAESAVIAKLNADTNDVLDQFFIDTATWGLANWERFAGVPVDESKPLSQRRGFVKSKIRGVGMVTVSLIKSVAESYVNGEVVIIEDNANYKITVRFVGKLGVPDNQPDIEKALRDIIPAHLAVAFEFTYATYTQLKAKYASYTALKTSAKTYGFILTDK
ncbi:MULTISPECIES: YmfQ family protein [Peribacillus]|uniref:YmfQ family protein n=1 Tax=Peribacillus TaxID=2675229 RepID=UPI001F4E81E2|nr:MULTISPECIES: YmfQ family protein [unclassified Peribacillus]MCK1985159.1 YmfQ family protein [Peribacillus sp. Aquil_B1]MCK2007191.1 YmfQ family protein [Peribacillus sp. Aquil_B8]